MLLPVKNVPTHHVQV